jgi:hypothetical protein
VEKDKKEWQNLTTNVRKINSRDSFINESDLNDLTSDFVLIFFGLGFDFVINDLFFPYGNANC